CRRLFKSCQIQQPVRVIFLNQFQRRRHHHHKPNPSPNHNSNFTRSIFKSDSKLRISLQPTMGPIHTSAPRPFRHFWPPNPHHPSFHTTSIFPSQCRGPKQSNFSSVPPPLPLVNSLN